MLKYLLFFLGTLSIYAQKEYCFQYDSAGNQRSALLCLNGKDDATDIICKTKCTNFQNKMYIFWAGVERAKVIKNADTYITYLRFLLYEGGDGWWLYGVVGGEDFKALLACAIATS